MNETASDTLKIGLTCAIAVHCFGLIFFSSPKYEAEDVPLNVIVKLENSTAATSPSGRIHRNGIAFRKQLTGKENRR